MISRFRHSLYSVGAVVLLLCLTGVSVRAQETADGSRDRTVDKQQTEGNTVDKQQTEGNIETASPAASTSIFASADNAKEIALSASSASNTAPVSFLLPRATPAGNPTAPSTEPAAASRPQGSSDKWEFMIAPYLWLAGINGTVGVGDLTTDIDPSVSDILNKLNFGFMAIFEARKNRLMIITDLLYISLEETKATSGPLFSSLTVKSKTFMLSPVVGYRLAEKEGASLDAIVGIRFWHTSSDLILEPGLLPGREREGSKNWVDVIGGLRGQAHFSRLFSVIGRGDFGGGGADYTYQLFGGLGIDVSKSISLFAGYRYLYIKYTRGDFLFDGAFKGAVLGGALRF
ncbi:MAG TPA: hypothetical protein VNS63_27340 [Blastocatellia bacterium]|nr:hypothetical protein [Blastocatellia bacterium]